MFAVLRSLRAALLLAVLPLAARAQGVPTLADDALVVPRGVVRIGFSPTWTQFDERYLADGSTAPLAGWTTDTLGAAFLPQLSALETRLRELASDAGLRVTLGRLRGERDGTILSVPLVAEVGFLDRLSLGIVVPIVRTRSFVYLAPNPGGMGGNIGVNPAIVSEASRSQNAALFAEFAQAIASLDALITACAAPSNTDPRCPAARTPAARALLTTATAFAQGLTSVYDDAMSSFVPVANSAIDQAIRARIASFASSFASYDITTITSSGPAAASIVGRADFLRVISDPAFGLEGGPLVTRVRTSIGDIEVGAKLQVVNTLRSDTASRGGVNTRFAIAGVFRAGTGTADDPDDFADIASGDGQQDLEGRVYWDLLLGRRVSVSIIGRYTRQLADREIVRVADPSLPFAEVSTRAEVERDLGDWVDLEATPRVAIGDFFSVMAQYRVRRKGEDRHRLVPGSDLSLLVDPAILDAESEQREDRVSVALGYSTQRSVARGRARVPLDILMQYGESVRGSGGRTPRVSVGIMQIRVYTRLF